MLRSPALRAALVAVSVVALLAILRFQSRNPGRSGHGDGSQVSGPAEPQHSREELTVGFLPVT